MKNPTIVFVRYCPRLHFWNLLNDFRILWIGAACGIYIIDKSIYQTIRNVIINSGKNTYYEIQIIKLKKPLPLK